MLKPPKKSSIETPFGLGRIDATTVTVPWTRHRGVLIDLTWRKEDTPDQELVQSISSDLDSIVDAGLARLGASEFPEAIRAVLPEVIDLSVPEGDFSLSFCCPDDEDFLLGVVFKDGEIVHDWEGH